jgi:outer membrane protein assembly factor BamD
MPACPLKRLTTLEYGLFLLSDPLMKAFLIVCTALVLTVSCQNKYQKALKSNDPAKKLELAQYYYNKKDYYRASSLFEQLQDSYAGTTMAEKVMYYSAYCNYGLQNYALAGYQFKTYFENFPTGQWSEESLYMTAYCQFLESQAYYLDQTDTYKGLEALKLFISVYPESKYISECNVLMDKLRDKLSLKAYKNAKLYYNIQAYKSAIVALQNAIREFPEMDQREELDYLTVKSHYLLADNSIEAKKEERFQDAINAYNEFSTQYPESRYLNELRKYLTKSEAALRKIRNKKEAI